MPNDPSSSDNANMQYGLLARQIQLSEAQLAVSQRIMNELALNRAMQEQTQQRIDGLVMRATGTQQGLAPASAPMFPASSNMATSVGFGVPSLSPSRGGGLSPMSMSLSPDQGPFDIKKVGLMGVFSHLMLSDHRDYSVEQRRDLFGHVGTRVANMGIAGAESVGTLAGGAVGVGAALMGAPAIAIGAPLAAALAIPFMANSAKRAVAESSRYQEILAREGFRINDRGGALQGAGFTLRGQQDFANTLSDVRFDRSMGTDEFSKIFEGVASRRLLSGMSNPDTFKRKVSELTGFVKTGMRILNQSADEVMNLMQEFDRLGIGTGRSDLRMAQLKRLSGMTGLSVGEVSSTLSGMTSQITQGTAISPNSVFTQGASLLASTAMLENTARRSGNSDMLGLIQNFGGTPQAAAVTQETLLNVLTNSGFSNLVANKFVPGSKPGEFSFDSTRSLDTPTGLDKFQMLRFNQKKQSLIGGLSTPQLFKLLREVVDTSVSRHPDLANLGDEGVIQTLMQDLGVDEGRARLLVTQMNNFNPDQIQGELFTQAALQAKNENYLSTHIPITTRITQGIEKFGHTYFGQPVVNAKNAVTRYFTGVYNNLFGYPNEDSSNYMPRKTSYDFTETGFRQYSDSFSQYMPNKQSSSTQNAPILTNDVFRRAHETLTNNKSSMEAIQVVNQAQKILSSPNASQVDKDRAAFLISVSTGKYEHLEGEKTLASYGISASDVKQAEFDRLINTGTSAIDRSMYMSSISGGKYSDLQKELDTTKARFKEIAGSIESASSPVVDAIRNVAASGSGLSQDQEQAAALAISLLKQGDVEGAKKALQSSGLYTSAVSNAFDSNMKGLSGISGNVAELQALEKKATGLSDVGDYSQAFKQRVSGIAGILQTTKTRELQQKGSDVQAGKLAQEQVATLQKLVGSKDFLLTPENRDVIRKQLKSVLQGYDLTDSGELAKSLVADGLLDDTQMKSLFGKGGVKDIDKLVSVLMDAKSTSGTGSSSSDSANADFTKKMDDHSKQFAVLVDTYDKEIIDMQKAIRRLQGFT